MEFSKRNIKIYILSGKASSGKSTVANIIKETIPNTITISYASYLKMYAKEILGWDGNEDTKPREFLQQVGVELIKNKIDSKMLIRRIIEDIKVYSYFYDVVVISDARFIEEIEDIKNNFNDVTVIHIKGMESNLTDEQKKHSTETSLDEYNDYDFEIINDDINITKEKVEKILEVSYGSSN